MAQQLIFTSAVAGLNPGSSGYCTVARSESMREAVAARLEQWSVYAHAARGPRPVVCAHRILNLRGSSFHVLTRIVDSGLDYTGRTNFLAHHLVLQPHEIHGACSPAEVFSNWKGWLTEWQGAPRYVDDANFLLHTIPRTTQMPARAWAEAAGDAGAAALLLKEGSENTLPQSADLIVPVGHEKGLLKLYAESLHLTDPVGDSTPASWAVTFTTFLQAENDGADFRWRGMWPEGSLPATGEVLCNFANGTIPEISSGPLAAFARTGARRAISQPVLVRETLPPGEIETSAGAFVGTIDPRIRNKSTSGRSGTAAPVTAASTTGWGQMPRWVWISLLCGIPAAVVVGLLLPTAFMTRNSADQVPRGTENAATSSRYTYSSGSTSEAGPSIAPDSPPPAIATPRSPAPSAFAERTNQDSLKGSNLQTIVAPALTSAKANGPDEEDVDRELAQLPDDPFFLTINSADIVNIPNESNNPLANLLKECATSPEEENGIGIELSYNTLDIAHSAITHFDGTYNEQNGQIVNIDKPACTFLDHAVEVNGAPEHDLINIVLKSKGNLPIRFTVAKTGDTLTQRCFRLSRRFLDIEQPKTLKLYERVRKALEERLTGWSGPEDWSGADHRLVKFALKATLAQPLPGVSPIFSSEDSDLEISFEHLTAEAKDKSIAASAAINDYTAKIQQEEATQNSINSSQKRLQDIEFPQSVKHALSFDSYHIQQNVSGLQYYFKIRDWLTEIGGDDYKLDNWFPKDPPGGRYRYIKDILRQLRQAAEQNVNKEVHSSTRKDSEQAPSRGQQMIDLTAYIDSRIVESDEPFLATASIDQAQFRQTLKNLQTHLDQAKKDESDARQLENFEIKSGLIGEVWLEAQISGQHVHLIEFVDDGQPQNALVNPSPSTRIGSAP